jgi:hypothetical protein
MQPEEMKRRIQMLGMLEQQGGDISDISPTRDNIEMVGSRTPLVPPAPMHSGFTANTAHMPDSPVAGIRDDELEDAKSLDQRTEADRLFEAATRQLIGGLTRTAPQGLLTQPVNAEKSLLGKRQQARMEALRQLEMDNDASRYAAGVERQKMLDERHKAERKEDLAEREKDNERADRGQLTTQELARSNYALAAGGFGLRKQEAETKERERSDKMAASEIPLMGGTLKLAAGLADSERSSARDKAGLWNAADASTEEFQRNLEAFAKSPNATTRGQMVASLRTAASAFNAAIGGGAMSKDEAAAMSEALGADLASPEGLNAIIAKFSGDDASAAAAISSRVKAARSANRAAAVGRLKTYGTYSEAPKAAPTAKTGRVVITNGVETLEIDASDLADAERDGFKRVK